MPFYTQDQKGVIIEELKRQEIILPGHFEYNSGLHGDSYVAKKRFMKKMPYLFEEFCSLIACEILKAGYSAIIAPESGGVLVAQEVMKNFTAADRINMVVAHKTAEGFRINPADKDLIVGRCSIVLEDVVTTGGSAERAGRSARELGASYNAIYTLFDRRDRVQSHSTRIFSIIKLQLELAEQPCRQCLAGVPLTPKPEY